jgi:hypothetical protein
VSASVPSPVLGAYALFAGLPTDELPRAYRALGELPVRTLEVPFADALGRSSLGPAGPSGLPDALGDSWGVVVTMIPTVMQRLHADRRYGLASDDEDARLAAVADVHEALDLAMRVAEQAGRPRVRAVQVHSAPGPGWSGTAAALRRSLEELLPATGPDLLLAVEHCDAPRPGRVPEKGFLKAAEEIAVLRQLGDHRAVLTVNWGRSAIEGRSASTPVEHVTEARKAGVLGGVMFSGATATPGPWGPAWGDAHAAPRGEGAALAGSSSSLLGLDEIETTLQAAGDAALLYTGLKITVGDSALPLAERLETARAALALLAPGPGAA